MASTIRLASGRLMPLVGFGLWKVPAEEVAETVYTAVKAGYRCFDGAYDYGNEKEAGQGLQRAIKEGLVKREDIFLTTKLWNTYHEKERALSMAKEQNETWGLGYIDLYLIHFPVALKYVDPAERKFPGWTIDAAGTKVEVSKATIRETWEALEQAVDQGIVRSIGVSNFQAQSIYDLQRYNRHPISALQIEHHPYLVQPALIHLAQASNIVITAYSSFGPQSFLEMDGIPAEKAKAIEPLLEAGLIKDLATKYSRTPSQILLRWATQRNVAVIPKSNNPKRRAENLDSLGFDLSKDDLDKITGMDRGLRFNDPFFYTHDHKMRIFG
ncbi:NADP-dependent oxidoreductase domain-containing protein [Xylogone sp. PMI_703]|nr:NADP-dependent oxidoreductase domain-containing protein [Xylogone sp. PMI_703]